MWYSKTYSCAECGNPVVGYDAKQIPWRNGLVVFLCPACAKKRPSTAWSATPLVRLLAKVHAFVAARLNPVS